MLTITKKEKVTPKEHYKEGLFSDPYHWWLIQALGRLQKKPKGKAQPDTWDLGGSTKGRT